MRISGICMIIYLMVVLWLFINVGCDPLGPPGILRSEFIPVTKIFEIM